MSSKSRNTGSRCARAASWASSACSRTASLVCVEAGRALCVSYSDVKQLYYQNPEFGFYFLKLTSERLFQSAQLDKARKPAAAESDVL